MENNNFSNESLNEGEEKRDFQSVEEAGEYLLDSLNGCFETKSVIDGNIILLPEWNITVVPRVAEIRENYCNTYYYVLSPDWDMPLYECSVAMGPDIKSALGMAQGGFAFGIGNAIGTMMRDENARELETEFAGNMHKWKVYLGNIVGMGKVPQGTEADVYWNALCEGIGKRIGNQKLCYVKIYGANIGNGDYTGECRINDVKIDELSDIVEKMVREWGTTEFGSHKQFFMIKQEAETTLPYPFTWEDISQKTEIAIRLFEDCKTQEEYEEYEQNLENIIGDKDLAWELYAFIPEICAQNAFDKINYPETLSFYNGGDSVEYYKTQIASYYAILDGVFKTLGSGVLKDADNVYREYISISSIWSVICAAKEKGSDIENQESTRLCIMFNPEDDYKMR